MCTSADPCWETLLLNSFQRIVSPRRMPRANPHEENEKLEKKKTSPNCLRRDDGRENTVDSYFSLVFEETVSSFTQAGSQRLQSQMLLCDRRVVEMWGTIVSEAALCQGVSLLTQRTELLIPCGESSADSPF